MTALGHGTPLGLPVLTDDSPTANVAEEQQSEAELPPLKIEEHRGKVARGRGCRSVHQGVRRSFSAAP